MYSEHFQRSSARKDPFCGYRIPRLHALFSGDLSFFAACMKPLAGMRRYSVRQAGLGEKAPEIFEKTQEKLVIGRRLW